MFLVYFNVFF